MYRAARQNLSSRQYGGGNCSLCGSPGVTKTTCPLNSSAKNPNPQKHPLASNKKPTKSTKKITKKAVPEKTKISYIYGPNDLYDIAKNKEAGWKDKLDDLWGQGLTYRGKDLIDTYLKINSQIPHQYEVQEAYLGYKPEDDTFISGFDWWPPAQDDLDEEDDAQMGTLLVEFTIDDNGNIDPFSFDEELNPLYAEGGVYDTILKTDLDIVDLRLD